MGAEDGFHDFLRHVVGDTEIDAGNSDKAQYDSGGLRDLSAIGHCTR